MSTLLPKIGSHISLISNSDIRYEGQLFTVDPIECTIALSDVHSYGTEDRPASFPVGPQDKVYDYILFRGSDIKDIKILPTKTDQNKTRSPAQNTSASATNVSTPPGFGRSVIANNAASNSNAGDDSSTATLRTSFSSPSSSSGMSQQSTKTPPKPSFVHQKSNNVVANSQNHQVYSSSSAVGTKLPGKDAEKSTVAAAKKSALAFRPPLSVTSSAKQQNAETPGSSKQEAVDNNVTKEVVISMKKSSSEDKQKEDDVPGSSGGQMKEETKQTTTAVNTRAKVYISAVKSDVNQNKATVAKNVSPTGQYRHNNIVMHRSRLPAHPSSGGGGGGGAGGSSRFGYALPEDYEMMLNNGRSPQIVPLMQQQQAIIRNGNRDDEMYTRYHYRHYRGENMMMMMNHRNKRDYDHSYRHLAPSLLDSPNVWHQQASFRAVARNNIGAAGREGGNWERNNMTNRMMNRFVGEPGFVMSPHPKYYSQPTMIYRPNARPTSGNRDKQQQQQEDFSSEYDFEEANIKFEQLKSQFAKVKINNNSNDVATESDSDGNKNETDTASANDGSEQSSTAAAENKVFYDKSKSFFDNISCEAFDQNKMKRGNWINDRKLNSETFGTLRSGTYRGGRLNYLTNNNHSHRDAGGGKNYRFGYGNRY